MHFKGVSKEKNFKNAVSAIIQVKPDGTVLRRQSINNDDKFTCGETGKYKSAVDTSKPANIPSLEFNDNSASLVFPETLVNHGKTFSGKRIG